MCPENQVELETLPSRIEESTLSELVASTHAEQLVPFFAESSELVAQECGQS